VVGSGGAVGHSRISVGGVGAPGILHGPDGADGGGEGGDGVVRLRVPLDPRRARQLPDHVLELRTKETQWLKHG